MLDNGCPVDVIGQILGHDNLDVTAHYAQVSTRLMMTTYNQAHPHARPDLRKPAGKSALNCLATFLLSFFTRGLFRRHFSTCFGRPSLTSR